jgi:hypothetical protein
MHSLLLPSFLCRKSEVRWEGGEKKKMRVGTEKGGGSGLAAGDELNPQQASVCTGSPC